MFPALAVALPWFHEEFWPCPLRQHRKILSWLCSLLTPCLPLSASVITIFDNVSEINALSSCPVLSSPLRPAQWQIESGLPDTYLTIHRLVLSDGYKNSFVLTHPTKWRMFVIFGELSKKVLFYNFRKICLFGAKSKDKVVFFAQTGNPVDFFIFKISSSNHLVQI